MLNMLTNNPMLMNPMLSQLLSPDQNATNSSIWKGSPARMQQVSTFTPQQQQVQNQALQRLIGMLQEQQDPYSGFQPIAQQAQNRFNSQIIPSLAERFTSTGSSLSSPAFASQLGQSGSDLSSNLAALQSQYGLQNRQMFNSELANLLGYGLQPSFESIYHKRQPGLFESAVPGIASGVSSALISLLPYALGAAGTAAGGPFGGAAGGAAGSALSALLSNLFKA
jgi:hypothetical protein